MNKIDFLTDNNMNVVFVLSQMLTRINRYSPILDITFNHKEKFAVVRCSNSSFTFQELTDRVRCLAGGTGEDFDKCCKSMASCWVLVSDKPCTVERD